MKPKTLSPTHVFTTPKILPGGATTGPGATADCVGRCPGFSCVTPTPPVQPPCQLQSQWSHDATASNRYWALDAALPYRKHLSSDQMWRHSGGSAHCNHAYRQSLASDQPSGGDGQPVGAHAALAGNSPQPITSKRYFRANSRAVCDFPSSHLCSGQRPSTSQKASRDP